MIPFIEISENSEELATGRISLMIPFIEIGEDSEELATDRISLMIPFKEQNLTDDSLHKNR
jgi:hypothetical protein